MQRIILAIGLAGSSLLASGADMPKDFPRLKAGMIESITSVNGEKFPAMRQCMTDDDLSGTPQAAGQGDCKVDKVTQSGKTAVAEMTCKSAFDGKTQKMRIESTMITADHFKGKMTSIEGGKTTMQSEFDMMRIGECSQKDKDAAKKAKDIAKKGEYGKFSQKEMLDHFKNMSPQERKALEDMAKQYKK